MAKKKARLTIAIPGSESSSVAVEFSPERSTLLIAFGGLGAKAGFVFEFQNLTCQFESVNKIFLRDDLRQWYHGGIPGVAPDMQGVAAFPEALHAGTDHTIQRGFRKLRRRLRRAALWAPAGGG